MEEKMSQLENEPDPSKRFANRKGNSNATLRYLTRYCEVPSRSRGLFPRGDCWHYLYVYKRCRAYPKRLKNFQSRKYQIHSRKTRRINDCNFGKCLSRKRPSWKIAKTCLFLQTCTESKEEEQKIVESDSRLWHNIHMNKENKILWQETLSRYDEEMARRRKENPLPFIISNILRTIVLVLIVYLFIFAAINYWKINYANRWCHQLYQQKKRWPNEWA